jgi:hypothetical protein
MKKISKKLFVIRKYILANSALEAIKKDKVSPVDDCGGMKNIKRSKLNNYQVL